MQDALSKVDMWGAVEDGYITGASPALISLSQRTQGG
jgi:hypothetical protein